MKNFFKSLAYSVLGAALVLGALQTIKVARSGVSCSVPFTLTNGTTADATQVMANFNALVTCFASAAEAGANSSITSLSGLTTPLSAAQGGSQVFWGGTSVGTNTVVVTTVAPTSGFTKTAGQQVCFIPGGTNTGATTLNVNATGAQSLFRRIQLSTGINGTGTLVGGELVASNNVVCAITGGGAYTLLQSVDYVGEIKDFGYVGCPAGWSEANAGTVVAATFPDINTAYGTTWGTSASNVVMPDLRGRTTFSRDTLGTRLTTDQNGALAGNTVGTMGGVQNQTLTAAQVPSLAVTGTGTVAFANSQPWLSMLSGTTATGSSTIAFGSSGSNLFVNNLNSENGGQITAPTVNLNAGTANGSGGGNSHPVTPPLGVVTKCVKL